MNCSYFDKSLGSEHTPDNSSELLAAFHEEHQMAHDAVRGFEIEMRHSKTSVDAHDMSRVVFHDTVISVVPCDDVGGNKSQRLVAIQKKIALLAQFGR